MATFAQISANRANAQHSTGPTSPEGKATVSKNATRHGFTAREVFVRPDERAEFEALSSELHTEVHPEDAIENTLFEQLLHSAWNLRRVRALETAEFEKELAAPDSTPDEAKLNRYHRYAVRFERTFLRTLKELRTMKTLRSTNETYRAATGDNVNILIDIGRVLKQTQRVAAEELYDEVFKLNQKRENALIAQTMANEAKTWAEENGISA